MTIENVKCPECDGPMVSRANKATGQRFWGCKRFPVCKGTRNTDGEARAASYRNELEGEGESYSPSALMTSRKERGCWLRQRCYACGHRLRFASTGCPQCGEDFDGRTNPRKWPKKCECERCVPQEPPS